MAILLHLITTFTLVFAGLVVGTKIVAVNKKEVK